MTQQFTQKYVLVQLIAPLPDGFEFSMSDWPLHVTLADVFKIDGAPNAMLARLKSELASLSSFTVAADGDDWFGPDRSVRVRLINKTADLQRLHDACVDVLESFGGVFNSPQYMRGGFRPHSTVHGDYAVASGDTVHFHAVTLIDMFPAGDHTRRKILATVPLEG